MNIFSENAIKKRQSNLTKQFQGTLSDDEMVLIFCGEPTHKPGGLDQEYDFLPHPDYYWISGLRNSHGVMVFGNHIGWKHFVKKLTTGEMIWEGKTLSPEGEDIATFHSWMEQHKSMTKIVLGSPTITNHNQINKMSQPNRTLQVQEVLNLVRRVKDEEEIALVRSCANAASKGYELLKKMIRPGISERALQIEYEAEVYRHGAQKMPYGSIVGVGTNSAILHASPSMRLCQEQEIILVDAGADIEDYCVDITRVFNSSGDLNGQQKDIFEIVLKAQSESIQLCQPGVHWSEVHKASALAIGQGLIDLNIIKGSVEELVQQGVVSLFFPHGVGHMVGHRVRDVGGDPTQEPAYVGGTRLRVNITLQDHYLMTVEPGLYFIAAILNDLNNRSRFKDQVNWHEVEKWMNFGGIRLEDDILVKKDSPENLTGLIPKV